MPRRERLVVPAAALRAVRSHRLLRHVAESACHRACALQRPHHIVIRSCEPGENWFYDYVSEDMLEDPRQAPPVQPLTGPGAVFDDKERKARAPDGFCPPALGLRATLEG
jgi:hypothetical protein